jgi:hypothetical protein
MRLLLAVDSVVTAEMIMKAVVREAPCSVEVVRVRGKDSRQARS